MDRAILTQGMSWLLRSLMLVTVVTAFSAGAPQKASATSMHCGNPAGYCYWGYNIVSNSVNTTVTGTFNSWIDSYLDKESGGTVLHGWYASPSCGEYLSANTNGIYTPADTGSGCPSYSQRFVQYSSGTQSYLLIDSCAAQSGLCSAGPWSRSKPKARDSEMTRGQQVSLLPSDLWRIQRLTGRGASLGEVFLLRIEASRAYYRISNSSGGDCYAVGPSLAVEYRLGQAACARDFPSGRQPVLDFSVVREMPGDPTSVRVTRSEGFAADRVAEVEFQTADGQVVGTARVVDNVYSAQSLPDVQITKILARDYQGSVVWSQPISYWELTP